jgi:hypothetical protein
VINFRYHVVSLTAVFLALAIGLVLGTAALNGPAADRLNSEVSKLGKSNTALRGEVTQLKGQVNSQEGFVTEAAPMLLTGRLTGRTVLVVTTDTTDPQYRDATVDMLKRAGAKLTGRIRVNDVFTDPRRDDALQDLATRVPVPGVQLPNRSVGVENASALLAAAVVKGGTAVSEGNRRSVLTAFSSLGAATIEQDVTQPADSVVVIFGQSPVDADADRRNAAMLTILRQFDRVAAHMVLAAPQAGGDGNPVGGIRGDDSLSKNISTVDNVSSVEGQVVTALALAEQFNGGKAGHYGSGEGSTARVPDLAKQ